MRLILLSAAILIAAAPAPVPQKEAPAATPTGEAVSCIPGHSIRETIVRNDKVIDFMVAGGKVYRNELDAPCPGLGSERRFIHKSSMNEYCSLDLITVLYSPPMIQGASCGLGKFQPVKLASSK